jgi:hypothetical protein
MSSRTPLAAVAFVAACLAAAPVAAEFKPLAGFDQQIFPSYIIATAPMRSTDESPDDRRLGDPRGVLGVEVVAPTDNAAVTVSIQCDDCLEPSVFSGTLPKAGKTYQIYPKIKYKYAFLARCTQAAPVSMTFRVNVNHADAYEEETVACTVRAVNDCPFAIAEGENVRDVSYTFAAYVNEQHPFVDKLLREALDRGVVDGFTGYQAGDPHEVMRQAYALWDLLVARDMRYSSITASAVSSETVASQHVRMIEDSVNNAQANCVDGSVLWASLLQRIGIDSFLVMESDHCYAGFFTDETHETAYAIETTMLGADLEDEEIEVPEIIDEAIPEESRDARSFASFVGAINYSTARLTASLAKESDDAVECQIIDVAQARRQGVLPIGFQNGEEFVWYDYSGGEDEYAADETEESDESEEEWSEDDSDDAYVDEADDEEEADEDDEESYEDAADDEADEGEVSEDEEEYDEEDAEWADSAFDDGEAA